MANLLRQLNGVLQEVVVVGSGDISVSQPTDTSIVISGTGGGTDTEVDATLTYNPDGSLASYTTALGSKTFTYTSGVLTGITGTGIYKSKTLIYSGGQLVTIDVI